MSEKNTNQNNKQTQPLRIKMTEHQAFEPIGSTAFETTQKLAKRINKLFLDVFSDYHGAVVHFIPGNGNVGGQFMVELHFKPMSANAINPNDARVRAFKPIEEGTNSGDVVDRLKNIYGSFRSSSKFQITDEASQILSEFMLNGTNVDPFKPSSYDQFKAEYQDNVMYGQAPIMIRIANLDLAKLVKKIYGGKNKDGGKVDYGIVPYGPVSPAVNASMANTANYRVQIIQISVEKTFDLASEFGMIPTSGYGAVVTGTI